MAAQGWNTIGGMYVDGKGNLRVATTMLFPEEGQEVTQEDAQREFDYTDTTMKNLGFRPITLSDLAPKQAASGLDGLDGASRPAGSFSRTAAGSAPRPAAAAPAARPAAPASNGGATRGAARGNAAPAAAATTDEVKLQDAQLIVVKTVNTKYGDKLQASFYPVKKVGRNGNMFGNMPFATGWLSKKDDIAKFNGMLATLYPDDGLNTQNVPLAPEDYRRDMEREEAGNFYEFEFFIPDGFPVQYTERVVGEKTYGDVVGYGE